MHSAAKVRRPRAASREETSKYAVQGCPDNGYAPAGLSFYSLRAPRRGRLAGSVCCRWHPGAGVCGAGPHTRRSSPPVAEYQSAERLPGVCARRAHRCGDVELWDIRGEGHSLPASFQPEYGLQVLAWLVRHGRDKCGNRMAPTFA